MQQSYETFRTGLSFGQIAHELRQEAAAKYAQGQYMFWTRATVLGRWHQYKQEMYSYYVSACACEPTSENTI